MRRRTEERQGPMTVPTGDPEALRSAAYRFGSISESLRAEVAVAKESSAVLGAVWTGGGADLARAEAAMLEQRTRVILHNVGAPMHAMLALATALEAAQRTTRWCLREQAAAEAQYSALVSYADLSFTPEDKAHKLTAAADQRDRRMRLARAKYETSLAELDLRRRDLTQRLADLVAAPLGAADAAPHSRLPNDIVGVRIAIAQEVVGDLSLTTTKLFPPATLRRTVNVYDNPETGLPEWSFQQKLIDAGIRPDKSVIARASWGVGAGVTAAQFGTGIAQPVLRMGKGARAGAVPRVSARAASTLLKADNVINKAGTAFAGITSAVGQLEGDNQKYANMSPLKRFARAAVASVASTGMGWAAGAACTTIPVAGPAVAPACGMVGTAVGQEAGRRINNSGFLKADREDTKRTVVLPLTGAWD